MPRRRTLLAFVLIVAASQGLGGKCNPFPAGTGGAPPPAPPSVGQTGPLRVGAAAVVVTPPGFETWTDTNANGEFDRGETFADDGIDRVPNVREPGALGPDAKPGRAGVDDDANGKIDDDSEYRAAGSDDAWDPAGDDFQLRTNPGGTEGDGVFQSLVLAGFQGAYYGVMRAAQSVHDDIWSRTVVIERGGTWLAIQSNDFAGMLHIDINPVKRRAELELGIPFRSIVIASTHNHASPDTMILWRGAIDETYMAFVRERMFQSLKRAKDSMVETRMKSVTVHPIVGYDPSTLELKDQRKTRDPDFEGDYALAPGKYDVRVLQNDARDPFVRYTPAVAVQFDDRSTGRTVATLVNWHDHPEVLGDRSTRLSSDFPHYLRSRIEARLGGACIYLSGALGGQIGALQDTRVPLYDEQANPVYESGVFDPNGKPFPKFVRKASVEKIRSIGYGVAELCLAGLATEPFQTDPVLKVDTQDLDIDMVNPLFQALAFALLGRSDTHSLDRPVKKPYLNPLVGGIRTQITVASLGSLQLVTGPGEICPEYFVGRRASVARYSHLSFPDSRFPAMPSIAKYMTGRDKMILSLANNYLGYLIPETDLVGLADFSHPNHYEELVTSGPEFGDTVGNKILQMLGSPERFTTKPFYP